MAAVRMGYPIALKIHSPDITHKSDAHRVELNLAGEDDLRQAFDRIMAGAQAYDPQARILGVAVQPADVPSSLHLVISPYPSQYETTAVTKGGLDILLRPIRPEDAPLHKELFETLSPQSVYFRFLSTLKALSPDMLARYTQVDYDREIALVAVQAREQSERLLGVGWVVSGPDSTTGEFAIAVGDHWQGQGVGVALLKKCVTIARERGLKSLWGIVLAENHRMIQLARYSGFTVKHIAHSAECEIRLDLTGPGFWGRGG